jgi:crotonobetainyl-CoA:carnitine CoA-transferase CaiB-like acyl-CoA transferase
MNHPSHDGLKIAAPPAQFDNHRPELGRPAPRIGEHSSDVLAEIGYTATEISDLVTSKTVISAPR